MPKRKRHFVVVKRGDFQAVPTNDGLMLRFNACTDKDDNLISVTVPNPMVALDMIDALRQYRYDSLHGSPANGC